MLEAGLVNKWKSDEVSKVGGRQGARGDEEQPAMSLTLTHLQGAFFIYSLGIASAATLLFAEICFFKFADLNDEWRI